MAQVAQYSKKDSPSISWLILAVGMLLFFIVLQLPAAWILARVLPNNPYLDNVSGNIWHGQGDWHYQNVQGIVSWQARPWMLLLLRVSANVEIKTGDTDLQGVVSRSPSQWKVDALNGQIDAGTLQTIVPWQWPSSPLLFKDVTVSSSKRDGFNQAEGSLSWGGGVLNYPYENHTERANLPPLLGELNLDHQRLHLALTDGQKERMGDLYVSAASASQKDMMLDVQLTQRLLLNVASYHGQAGLDTAVISTRQPLSSVGAM